MKGIDFNNLPQDQKTSQKLIDKSFEASVHERELGALGKFFGAGDTVKMNIAGLTIIVLTLTGIIYTFCILYNNNSNNPKAIGILEFWGIITPIITLALGFVFGKSQK
ncbi:MAG: hypothetical protein ACO1N9_09555 [Flavobacterium sp.]